LAVLKTLAMFATAYRNAIASVSGPSRAAFCAVQQEKKRFKCAVAKVLYLA
jgi:hypothetical protein